MKKYFLLFVLTMAAMAGYAQLPIEVMNAIEAAKREKARKVADTTKATTAEDSIRRDSLVVAMKIKQLEAISVKAPRPIYSMDGEVVSYNVADDATVKGLTAMDALQNAPSVEVDIEGNITMRGSSDVEIWMNGYPTNMNGATLKVYLESLPADAIDRIEVIKNPSAKYMVAEGCHIINIVTSVKIRNSHFVSFGTRANSRPSFAPWACYVIKNEKLTANIYLNASYSRNLKETLGGSTMRADGADGTIDTTAISATSLSSDARDLNCNIFATLSYQADSMNEFSLWGMGWMMPSDDKVASTADWWYFAPDRLHYINNNSTHALMRMGNGIAVASWRHKFDQQGHNLSISLNTNLNSSASQKTECREYTLLEGVWADYMRPYDKLTNTARSQVYVSLNATYNRPVGDNDELTFGAAVQPSFSSNSLDCSLFDSASMAYAITDTLRSYIIREHGYLGIVNANWRHKWERVTLTLGLRASATRSDYEMNGIMPFDTVCTRFRLDPSLGLTYRTESMHYLRLNYTFGKTYPSLKDLAPTPCYSEDSYQVGNPALEPSYQHNINLSWNRYFASKGSVGVESYAKYTSGEIDDVTDVTLASDPYLGRLVSFTMPFNMGSSYAYGIESNVTFSPKAWFNLRLYANLYRSGFDIQHPTIGHQQQSTTSYSLRANAWVKIAKRVRVNVSGNYASPTQQLFGRNMSSYTVDLGANSDFWGKRLALALSISDLFNWGHGQSWNTNPYLLSYSDTYTNSRYISLSVTLRFGKMDLQWQAKED